MWVAIVFLCSHHLNAVVSFSLKSSQQAENEVNTFDELFDVTELFILSDAYIF